MKIKLEDKRPNLNFRILLTVYPLVFVIISIIVPATKCYEAGLKLGYEFGAWMAGIGVLSLILIIANLIILGERYIWSYLQLVKYLKARGLDKFIQEAKQIKEI